VLLANPDTEIPAIELVAGVAALGRVGDGDGGAAQPVLDRAAVTSYRDRVAELTAEIYRHETNGHHDRAARPRAERDWLLSELATTAGVGGRVRTFADSGERARLAAGRAIRRAITKITQLDPVIGAHLHRTVHTGMRCSYRPV
jgi:hypothetical protein